MPFTGMLGALPEPLIGAEAIAPDGEVVLLVGLAPFETGPVTSIAATAIGAAGTSARSTAPETIGVVSVPTPASAESALSVGPLETVSLAEAVSEAGVSDVSVFGVSDTPLFDVDRGVTASDRGSSLA